MRSHSLLTRPWVLWGLVVLNGLGGLYGTWWYWDQLAVTPWYLWPVVPDSPLSAILFGLALLLFAIRRRAYVLEAVGTLLVMKYGAWAALVIGQFWAGGGLIVFGHAHLFISHLGMAIEGVLYAGVLRPGRRWVWLAAGWALLSDILDYSLGVYPTLQNPGLWPWARAYAFALTAAATLVLLAKRRDDVWTEL